MPQPKTQAAAETRRFATAADILAAPDETFEDVWVPEWQTMIRLRSLRGTERDEFDATRFKFHNGEMQITTKQIRAKLLVLAAVDLDGNALFRADQVTALGRKNAAILDRLFAVAARLSGLTPQAVEDEAGESASGQSDDSGIDLPSPLAGVPSPSSSGA